MDGHLLTTLGVGLLLGFRHALNPDHLLAVTTIASRTGSLLKATASGMYWGIGHTFTLLLIGIPLLTMKMVMPASIQMTMEVVVGCMLVLLGWTSLRSFQRGAVGPADNSHRAQWAGHRLRMPCFTY